MTSSAYPLGTMDELTQEQKSPKTVFDEPLLFRLKLNINCIFFEIEAKNEPSLDLKSVAEVPPLGHHRAKYLVLMIDLDVPRNDTTLPLLHWYQPDLIIKDKKSRVLSIPHSSKQQKAKYIAPSPPPGSPHRYVQVLFVQPDHYIFPREFEKYLGKKSEARLGFEIKEFIRAAKLDEPLAGNWFLVQTSEKDRDDL